jgi:hypothetical protein
MLLAIDLVNRNFFHALNFTNLGCFVNPVLAPLSIVEVRERRLVMAGTQENAVFFLTGLVQGSYLRTPYVSMYNLDSSRVHRLELAPFGGQFRRAIAYLGTAFGVSEMAGPIVDSHVNISTRKEGAASTCQC